MFKNSLKSEVVMSAIAATFQRDLNPSPLDYKSSILITRLLLPQILVVCMGVHGRIPYRFKGGFESKWALLEQEIGVLLTC